MPPAVGTIGRFLAAGCPDLAPDADLVARFAVDRDEGAFAELARRHGRMVLAAARRAVADAHLAEDVAQAVFLVLARKSGHLTRPDRLAGWLFGVTRRVARKAAARHDRDAARARPLTDRPADPDRPSGWQDALRVLDEELVRLPQAEQVPLILCYLEGLTQDEAARACGWSVRTVRRRLAAGRDRLRERLERRGVELGSVLTAIAVGNAATAASLSTLSQLASGVGSAGKVAELAYSELQPGAGALATRWAIGVVAVCGLALGFAVGPQPQAAPPRQTPADTNERRTSPAAWLGGDALRHPDNISALRFSPDGREVISYGNGKTRRWDARTGVAVRSAERDVVVTTAYSLPASFPTAPGNSLIAIILTQSPPYRETVRRYDLATGLHEDLFPLPPLKHGAATKFAPVFAVSPDGSLMARGDDGTVTLWDLTKREARLTIELPDGRASSIVFTPDGTRILTAGAGDQTTSPVGRTIRFWDVRTGKESRSIARTGGRIPNAIITRVTVSPDGRWVAGVDNSHLIGHGTELTVWDLDQPEQPRVFTMREGSGHYGALAFGTDGTVYTVATPDSGWLSLVSRWGPAPGERSGGWDGPRLPRFPFHGAPTVAISPDGDTLAIGTHTGVIRLYDTGTGKEIVVGGPHAAEITSVTFDPAGRDVRTASADGSVATWDTQTGAARSRRDPPPVDDIAGPDAFSVLSPDGQWLLTQRKSHKDRVPFHWQATLWEAVTGGRGFTWKVDEPVYNLLPVPGGNILLGSTSGQQVRTWDSKSGDQLAILPGDGRHFDPFRTRYAITPDGRSLIACDAESVTGYDPRTGGQRFTWKLADRGILIGPGQKDDKPCYVQAIAASPDGGMLALSVGGPAYFEMSKLTNSLLLIEAESGKIIRRVPTPETLAGWLVFSPDGRQLAGPRCVWEVETLAERLRFPARPEVTAAAFSPDGKRVATGHVNGTAAIWDVKSE
jgi:RNA polymerase sigma factor (sigma-70 family)